MNLLSCPTRPIGIEAKCYPSVRTDGHRHTYCGHRAVHCSIDRLARNVTSMKGSPDGETKSSLGPQPTRWSV